MRQAIIIADPPLMDEIDAAFKTRGKPVFYSFGSEIYNPAAVEIGPALLAHEREHGLRQLVYGDNVDGWWRAYIADPAFRLAEEIPAHRAEYQWWLGRPFINRAYPGFRSDRHYRLHFIASRLSGPLYGKLISLNEAKRLIEEGGNGQG